VEPELPDLAPDTLHVYFDDVPATIVLQASMDSINKTFVASYSKDRNDSLDSYLRAIHAGDNLIQTHIQVSKNHFYSICTFTEGTSRHGALVNITHFVQAWRHLWDEGRIEVDGNPELASDLAAAQYNILCSLPVADDPVTPFYGLGPGTQSIHASYAALKTVI